MEAFMGQIMLFAGNYAPDGWMFCDGTLLKISSYQPLYALIGVTYGGDGVNTFALPNLRSRVPLGSGTGTNLSPRTVGQSGGEESVTLTTNSMPAHNHILNASQSDATSNIPRNALLASPGVNHTFYLDAPAGMTIAPAALGASSLAASGSSVSHNNLQPFGVVNYLICVAGVYPTRAQ